MFLDYYLIILGSGYMASGIPSVEVESVFSYIGRHRKELWNRGCNGSITIYNQGFDK